MQLSQNIKLIQAVNNHLRVHEGFNTVHVEKISLDAGRLSVTMRKTSSNNLQVKIVSRLRISEVNFDLNHKIDSTLEHLIVCCDCLISETL
tara:strand:+ start:10484 stop:10756 length:273 start_codon:yes stop_codon:yes gene_type:complete